MLTDCKAKVSDFCRCFQLRSWLRRRSNVDDADDFPRDSIDYFWLRLSLSLGLGLGLVSGRVRVRVIVWVWVGLEFWLGLGLGLGL